ECPTAPPDVTAPFEDLQCPLPRVERGLQVARDLIDVGQTALGVGGDLFEASGVGDGRGFPTVGDGNGRLATRQAVQEAGPVEPGGAAAWIGLAIAQPADRLQRLDL